MITLLRSLALLGHAAILDALQKFATDTSQTEVDLHGITHESSAPKPHILFLLIDDLGWSDVGFNLADKKIDVATPNLDRLAHEGVLLDRHYVHHFCSPTRSAIQSGRSPIHVNVLNLDLSSHNSLDPVSGFQGIPRNMTGMAEVMKKAGYSTHMVGKWDAGAATPDHTPAGRGYDTSMIFFRHTNSNWGFRSKANGCDAHSKGKDIYDMWIMYDNISFPGRPADGHVAETDKTCSFENQHPSGGKCVYEDRMFEDRVTHIIRSHNPARPLFLFWATRGVHDRQEPPDDEMAKFFFIDFGCSCDDRRKRYAGTVSVIDGSVGRVVNTLKEKNMYENTLIVMSSDNGAEIPAGNNFPLKGGKFTAWEGGIRVAAFVSGGFVPQEVRGSVQRNLVTGWDWYATFAALAGVDPTDAKAAKAGLPPHDSINQWPLLSGATKTAPRRLVEIGDNVGGEESRTHGSAKTVIGGVIVPPYKIVIGENITRAGWTARQSLNETTNPREFRALVANCGLTPETGCLYDVFNDPQEYHNLAQVRPDVFQKLLSEAEALNRSVFSPDRGKDNKDAACGVAFAQYGGFWGPWLE